MALYDDLPLDTPTLVGTEGDCDVWATRTVNGGMVERRVRTGTDTDRRNQLATRVAQALATNSTYLGLASPTAAQTTAQVKALTRQVSALIRLSIGQFDAVD